MRGGIEDWAYAGSWGQGKGTCDDTGSSRSVRTCAASVYGAKRLMRRVCDMCRVCDRAVCCSYPASQSSYSSDMLRAINFLVETTDDKR